MIRWVWRRGAQ